MKRYTYYARCAVIVLAMAASASSAAAQSSASPSDADLEIARRSYDVGEKKLEAGLYAEALPLFRLADRIVGVPTTRHRVAQALAGMGKLVEARDVAASVARIPRGSGVNEAFDEARVSCAALVRAMNVRIARVTLVAPAANNLKVWLDGRLVWFGGVLQVNPGMHTLRVMGDGFRPSSQILALVDGQVQTVVVKLVPTAAPDASAVGSSEPGDPYAEDTSASSDQHAERKTTPPDPYAESADAASDPYAGVEGLPVGLHDGQSVQSPSRTLAPTDVEDYVPVAWTGLVIGGAGLLVGVIAGGVALSLDSALNDKCESGDGNDCPPSQHHKLDEVRLAANVSTVGFLFAGLGTVVGLGGLVAADAEDDKKAAVAPLVGPGFVGLQGKF